MTMVKDRQVQPVSRLRCTGAAPCRLITYADRYYLEAELIASGKATSPNTLQDAFNLAMKASFNQVKQVATAAAHVSQTVPTILAD